MPVVTIGDNTTDDFSGSAGCNLYEGAANTFSASWDFGKYGVGDYRYGLIKFSGISSLPDSITVAEAFVTATTTSTSGDGNSHVFTLRRCLRTADYTDATYNEYDADADLTWATQGGLGSGTDRSATISTTSEGIPSALFAFLLAQDAAQFRTDIERAASGADPNDGWHVERTDGSNDAGFRVFADPGGSDGSRPFLTVDYEEVAGGASILLLVAADMANIDGMRGMRG